MNKCYCLKCKENVDLIITNEIKTFKNDSLIIEYEGKKAYCSKCGCELYDDEIMKFNQQAVQNKIIELNQIITQEEIKEILRKYNIGKRPLSLLLGFGEITITRYLNGYIPTKNNSKLLKKLLNSPSDYYSMLQMNKNNISEVAFLKSEKATKQLLDIKCDDNVIFNVSKYIINKIDITNMGLQKLLYYIQLFYMGLYNKYAFTSICKAWDYGPVFGSIYHKYKSFNKDILSDEEPIEEIEEDLKKVIDSVIKYFGCYAATKLRDFTHNEALWQKVYNDGSNNKIIEKSELKDFAYKIVEEYSIKNTSDIKKYSLSMFEKTLL